MAQTRRQFLRATAAAAGLGSARAVSGAGADSRPAALATPTPAQRRWQDCEIGLLYSFDLAIAARRFSRNNTVRERIDPKLYNPAKLDTDQWLQAARAAGAKYAVFTATHFNGFMQWSSDLYPYGLKQAAWRDGRGDVVGDFVRSCRRAGVLPGLYFSTHRNVWWTVWGHYVDWGRGKGTAKQAAFNRVAEKMTAELCSRYGPLVQIWFDAGVKTPAEGGPDVLPIFEKHQPDSVFYHSRQRSDHRWIGNEAGRAGYPCWARMPGRPGAVSHNHPSWKRLLGRGDPEGTYWSPGMVDVPLRGARGIHNWFWAPNQDHGLIPAERLVTMYYNSVGRNCNLLLGEVITPEGLVPEADIRRLEQFGREIRRRFGRPLARTAGRGRCVELKLPRPGRVDHVVFAEQIAHGERIRRYRIEGLTPPDVWKPLAEGFSVGHKRIERFDGVEVAAVRLVVTEAVAEPRVAELAAFRVAT